MVINQEGTGNFLEELIQHQTEMEMPYNQFQLLAKQLLESRKNYQNLFEFAPVGYLMINEDGLIKEANKASSAKLRVERSRLLNKQLVSFIDPSDTEVFYQFFEKLSTSGSEQKAELKLTCTYQDKPVFIRMKGSCYRSETNNQLLYRIAITDISDFKAGQRQLQEKNAHLEREIAARTRIASELKKYAAIVHSAYEAIISISLDEKVTSWNPAAVSIFGYSEEEIRGKQLSVLLPNDLLREWQKIMKTLRQQQHVKNYTARWLHKNGSDVWLRLNISPLLNDSGQIEGAFAIAEDITQQKQAEQDLKRSQLLLQESQAAGLVGTFRYYVQENQVEWSDELYRIFGFVPGEVEPSVELILSRTCPPDRPLLAEKLAQIPLVEKESFNLSLSICTPAGDVRIIRIVGKIKKTRSGKGIEIIGTAQDITAAKKAEDAQVSSNAELQQEVLFRKEAEQRANKEMELNQRLTESSADGICAIDQNGVCITWNSALEGYTKTDRKEALGKKLTEVLPAFGGARIAKKIKSVLQGNRESLSGISFNSIEEVFDAILVPLKDKQGEQFGGLCILHNVSESNRIREISLTQKLEQQKELLHAVLKAQEAERKRIAEVLHNGLGQLLYATKLNLESITAAPYATSPSRIMPAIKDVLRLMEEAISETRVISHDLMPTILEDFGLKVALKELCKKLTMPNLRFCLEEYATDFLLDINTEIALYRIIQELMNNVIKHAGASLAEITLLQKGNKLVIIVNDNGRGFRYKKSSLSHGIGLSSIESRLKLMNGSMKITSSSGTTVRISIPL